MYKIKIDCFHEAELSCYTSYLIADDIYLNDFSEAILNTINYNGITMDKISNSIFYINNSKNYSIYDIGKTFYYTIIKLMLSLPSRLNTINGYNTLYLYFDYYEEE